MPIPQDVEDTPAGPDGNGFVVLGTIVVNIVGSDGEIYVRENGKVRLAPEEEDDPSS